MRREGSITRVDFSASDVACPCGACDGYPEEWVTEQLLAWAEEIQRALGAHRIYIIGGYWCEGHARRMAEPGGEEHLSGNALDIVTRDLSPGTLQRSLVPLMPGIATGMGSFGGYTHLDRGKTERRWRR